MSRGKKILAGIAIGLVLLCGGFMLFVNWANSDAGQQAMNEVSTQQAIESTTAAAATAQAAGTATAAWADINKRIDQAELVFEENFDEGSPFLAKYDTEKDAYFRDGIPEFIVAWNGYHLWGIDQNLTDFIAEVDCATNGGFCGIAYGVNMASNESDVDIFYASSIGTSDQCIFDDHTSSFPSVRYEYCNFPPSPAEGFLHRVRVERFGNIMRFYVNGELMQERTLEDNAAASGDIAFYFGKAGDESGIQTVQVGSLKVWKIP